MSSHVKIAEIAKNWLLHLEQRHVGPVMVLEVWNTTEQRWMHMRDIIGAPSSIGVEWDDKRNRPADRKLARAALERLLGEAKDKQEADDKADSEKAAVAELFREELLLQQTAEALSSGNARRYDGDSNFKKMLVIETCVVGPAYGESGGFIFAARVPRSATNNLGMTISSHTNDRAEAAEFMRKVAAMIEAS